MERSGSDGSGYVTRVVGYRQNPLVRLNNGYKVKSRSNVNVVIEKDRSAAHNVFYLHYAAQKVIIKILQINEYSLDTSSGAYTAIFHSPSACDTQTDRL